MRRMKASISNFHLHVPMSRAHMCTHSLYPSYYHFAFYPVLLFRIESMRKPNNLSFVNLEKYTHTFLECFTSILVPIHFDAPILVID